MLAYEYAVNALSASDWVKEKRKQIKEMQHNHRKLSYIDFSIPILAGAIAGFMSWCLVIPFDTIKTIAQAEIDPVKHGDMAQMFQAKTKVN